MKKALFAIVALVLGVRLIHAQGAASAPALAVRVEQDKVWLGGECDLIHKHSRVRYAAIGLREGGTVAHPYHLDALLRDAIGDGHGSLEEIAGRLGAELNGPLQNALRTAYAVEKPTYWRLLSRRPLLEILMVKDGRAYIARWSIVQAANAAPYATPTDSRFLEPRGQGGIGAVPRVIPIGTDLRDEYAACGAR